VDTALSVENIIGIVIGILGAIATVICLLMLLCYCCKNKNRNHVWAERSPPPYYYENQGYVNTPHYYQQSITNEKY
jgi:hypothetical protein